MHLRQGVFNWFSPTREVSLLYKILLLRLIYKWRRLVRIYQTQHLKLCKSTHALVSYLMWVQLQKTTTIFDCRHCIKLCTANRRPSDWHSLKENKNDQLKDLRNTNPQSLEPPTGRMQR